MLTAAALTMGCADAPLELASGLGLMAAAPAQTYRLTAIGMSITPEQLEDRTFPERLHENIHVSDLAESEKLSRLFGGKLDEKDTDNVKEALRDSLRNAGLLSNDQKTARYQLATIVVANKLKGAADITVTTHMQFRLVDAVTGDTLMNESIASPSTVLFTENHLYKVRIGKAMEGSVRENFRALLNRLRQVPVM